eukprot:22561-Eustigmatos_ZCMA.PRE.1
MLSCEKLQHDRQHPSPEERQQLRQYPGSQHLVARRIVHAQQRADAPDCSEQPSYGPSTVARGSGLVEGRDSCM